MNSTPSLGVSPGSSAGIGLFGSPPGGASPTDLLPVVTPALIPAASQLAGTMLAPDAAPLPEATALPPFAALLGAQAAAPRSPAAAPAPGEGEALPTEAGAETASKTAPEAAPDLVADAAPAAPLPAAAPWIVLLVPELAAAPIDAAPVLGSRLASPVNPPAQPPVQLPVQPTVQLRAAPWPDGPAPAARLETPQRGRGWQASLPSAAVSVAPAPPAPALAAPSPAPETAPVPAPAGKAAAQPGLPAPLSFASDGALPLLAALPPADAGSLPVVPMAPHTGILAVPEAVPDASALRAASTRPDGAEPGSEAPPGEPPTPGPSPAASPTVSSPLAPPAALPLASAAGPPTDIEAPPAPITQAEPDLAPDPGLAIASERLGQVAVRLSGGADQLQVAMQAQPAAASLIGSEASRLQQDLAAAGVVLAGLSVNGQRADLSGGGRRAPRQPRAAIDGVAATGTARSRSASLPQLPPSARTAGGVTIDRLA